MTNVTGSIALSGVTDKEMARIWETKAKHGESFGFNPQGIQVIPPHPAMPVRPGQPPQPGSATATYNNVNFTWQSEQGLVVVEEVIAYLLRKEEQAEAVAQ